MFDGPSDTMREGDICPDTLADGGESGVTGSVSGKDKGKWGVADASRTVTCHGTYQPPPISLHRLASSRCLGRFCSLSPGLSCTGHCVRASTTINSFRGVPYPKAD